MKLWWFDEKNVKKVLEKEDFNCIKLKIMSLQ